MRDKILPIVLLIGGVFIAIAGMVSTNYNETFGEVTGTIMIIIGTILFFAMGNKKDNDTNK